MKAVLIRTGSAPAQNPSPKIIVGDQQISVTGVLLPGKGSLRSPTPTVHFEVKDKKCSQGIRRTRSETDVVHSVRKARVYDYGSRSFEARITEEEEDGLLEDENGGTLVLKKKGLNLNKYERMRRVLEEEVEFSGGGFGNGKNVGGGNGGGGGENEDEGNPGQTNMGDYYNQLLKANPGNPLILRNYGKYLHEVKGDMVKAEECYSRALLASPGDGEVLSLYGKLIWESSKDGKRADSYYSQAVQAAPEDCYVMGSYANFLWSADEDEEDEEEEEINEVNRRPSTTLIQAC